MFNTFLSIIFILEQRTVDLRLRSLQWRRTHSSHHLEPQKSFFRQWRGTIENLKNKPLKASHTCHVVLYSNQTLGRRTYSFDNRTHVCSIDGRSRELSPLARALHCACHVHAMEDAFRWQGEISWWQELRQTESLWRSKERQVDRLAITSLSIGILLVCTTHSLKQLFVLFLISSLDFRYYRLSVHTTGQWKSVHQLQLAFNLVCSS